MSFKKLNKSTEQGFTIIEVMIVLAIGGFILVLTFLAIPSLYAHVHNDQRKADIGSILQIVSSYELNNSGDFPPSCGPASNNTALNCDSTTGPFQGDLLKKLVWYGNNAGGDSGISVVPLSTSAGSIYYEGGTKFSSLGPCSLDMEFSTCIASSLLNPSSSDVSYSNEINIDNNYVTIYDYERCTDNPSSGVVASSQGSSYSDIIAVYMVQNGPSNSFEAQCQQLAS